MRRAGRLAVAAAFVCSAARAAALDGATFDGEAGGKGFHRADQFRFRDGLFESESGLDEGYRPAPYQDALDPDGRTVVFMVHALSDRGGQQDWKGTVRGAQIEGSVVTAEAGRTTEGWFKGTLRDPSTKTEA